MTVDDASGATSRRSIGSEGSIFSIASRGSFSPSAQSVLHVRFVRLARSSEWAVSGRQARSFPSSPPSRGGHSCPSTRGGQPSLSGIAGMAPPAEPQGMAGEPRPAHHRCRRGEWRISVENPTIETLGVVTAVVIALRACALIALTLVPRSAGRSATPEWRPGLSSGDLPLRAAQWRSHRGCGDVCAGRGGADHAGGRDDARRCRPGGDRRDDGRVSRPSVCGTPGGLAALEAPAPPAHWSGTRLATTFGPNCPQPASNFGLASMSENCLYLNVYKPEHTKSNTGSLPVMVLDPRWRLRRGARATTTTPPGWSSTG